MDSKFEHPISFFEATTALAFAAFAEHPVDVGVIEVGMGGEWDATNVVDADVSVIMPIGFDHMEYLGNTLREIASTKAGIIKEGGFVVLAQQEPEAAKELIRKAAEVGADVVREGVEFSVLSRAVAVGGQLLRFREFMRPTMKSSYRCMVATKRQTLQQHWLLLKPFLEINH